MFSSAVAADEQVDPNNTASAAKPNVILIIGDGMDDQQITIARNYLAGARGRLTLDQLPHRSAVQVLTVAEAEPHNSVYVADSANSASAMATGHITSRGRIATSAGQDKDLLSIVELAAIAGIKTGLVSTASVTDATVSAFYAHISIRACENPALMENALIHDRITIDCSPDMKKNGGLRSISEQLVNSSLDLALGGGLEHFEANIEGGQMSVAANAKQRGFELVSSIEQLTNAPLDKRWLGLFAANTLPVAVRGEDGREAEQPDPSFMNSVHWSQGEVSLPEPMRCEPNPEFNGIPRLKLMTERALAKLSHENDRGFFLMIESASIDKQSHERKACGSIGEVAQLNEALDSALHFAEKHANTLIIVTADHGQAAQLIPDESLFKPFGFPVYTPGKLVRIMTPENGLMAVNYATNDFFLEEHTGVNVPLFSNQQGLFPTLLSQHELFTFMKDHLGL